MAKELSKRQKEMAKHSKRARKAVPLLALGIPFAALFSVVAVAISMSTGNWLDSYERVTISNSSIIEEFIVKRTVSGLWYLCTFNLTEKQYSQKVTSVGVEHMNCSTIDYFMKDRYLPDPNDSTNAIRYAVTKAGPLFVVATIFLGVAVIAAVFGYQRHRRIALFVSGIIFVVSGLMLLIGLVVYLSALQSEIGPKLRPRTSVEMPQFTYEYGFSFILVVVGFMATEVTGILAIFYYIYWHQLDWAQKSASTSRGKKGGKALNETCPCQGHQCSGGEPHRGFKISDIYDLDKRGCQHHSEKFSHSHPCSAYLSDKDKPLFSDYDVPFPPPPPPTTSHYLAMPRDYTTLTSCSDEDGSVLFPLPSSAPSCNRTKDRDQRNTPV